MKNFFKKFKEFAFRGNVVDLAVGMMIGSAFTKIVTSVVNDLFMPIISIFTGKMDFTNLFIALDGKEYATLKAAQDAGAPCFTYGNFLSSLFDFLLMALIIFMFVNFLSKLKKPEHPKEAPRTCPYCKSEIAKDATRCPHCTSELEL